MQVIKIRDNILCFKFPDQSSLCSTFLRIQEFHESPIDSIRNKFFTIDSYKKKYIKINGDFDYYRKWGGFNITSSVIKNFYKLFYIDHKSLTDNELKLFKKLGQVMPKWRLKKFCIIGVVDDNKRYYVDHEFAHSLYYLNGRYKKKVNKLICDLECYNDMVKKLKAFGYSDVIMNDEIQAYLSTSDNHYLKNEFGIENARDISLPFKELYKKFKNN